MSILTLQLGQCGNQIGGKLFETLMEDVHHASGDTSCTRQQNAEFNECSLSRFFNSVDQGSYEARAVMVDMEPKVISQALTQARQSGLWRYPDKRQFCQKRGSGNNWAHGYCVHGPRTRDTILEMVRKEVEKCDYFGGFLILMSLAGGTGSGLGAAISETLRDDFPHCFMVNQVVWPYHTGEVIVQNYNAVLTLSHLYQASDAIITMDNDSLHRICSQLQGIKNVSFHDINALISHKLAHVLQPCFHGNQQQISDHMGQMLSHLVAQPEFKLLTVRDLPHMSVKAQSFSVYQWPGLLKHLHQMLIADSAMEEGINWQVKATAASHDFNKSLSNLCILRGLHSNQANTSALAEKHLYPTWAPSDWCFQEWTHPRMFRGYEKTASLLSNSQSPVKIMKPTVQKAWDMFASRAYVHHYLNHGLTEEDFLDSFAALEQVLVSYKRLN